MRFLKGGRFTYVMYISDSPVNPNRCRNSQNRARGFESRRVQRNHFQKLDSISRKLWIYMKHRARCKSTGICQSNTPTLARRKIPLNSRAVRPSFHRGTMRGEKKARNEIDTCGRENKRGEKEFTFIACFAKRKETRG